MPVELLDMRVMTKEAREGQTLGRKGRILGGPNTRSLFVPGKPDGETTVPRSVLKIAG